MGSLIISSSPTLLSSCPTTYKLYSNYGQGGVRRGSITMTGRTETLVVDVPFDEFQTFANWCAGKSTISGSTVTRYQPLQNPFFASIYCIGIDYESIGGDTNNTLARPWTWMRCTLQFGTLPWDPNGATPYFTVDFKGTTAVATVPGAKLHFTTGEYIDHDWGVLLGQYAIQLTLFQMPSISNFLSIYGPLMGQTNSDTVTILGTAYAPGYLMLNTADAQMQVNSLGVPQNQGTVTLIWRSIPWNNGIDSNASSQGVLPAPIPTTAMSGAFS